MTVRKVQFLFVALMASAGAAEGAHADCALGNLNAAVPATAPLSEFAEADDGTLRHRRTGLFWQRCALGQSWDGANCIGSPATMNWTAALEAAVDHVQAGQGDWRLPNRNELASILEMRCFAPALDADAFPSAPVLGFWSSTPVAGGGELVWIVDVDDGEVVERATDTLQAVRLVRGRF